MAEDGTEEKLVEKRSFMQRLNAARAWITSSWTDEAVLIYRRSAHGKDRLRVLMVEFLLFVREVVREFFRFSGPTRAASLAYTTLVSLVPLVVAFSLVLRRYFASVFPDLRSQADVFLNLILPYQASQVSNHMQRFTENAEAASTFGALAFLVISFRLFIEIESTVNLIWRVETERSYRKKLRSFTMLLFWGPLLIGLSFTTTASLERNPYLRTLLENNVLISMVPLVVLLIAFTMLFWLVPSTRVKFKSAAFGGLVTALLFELVRFGFGLYTKYFFAGTVNVIYGTLGLLLIFLFAVELMWTVILLGVQICYVHQNFEGLLRASEQQIEEDPRYNLYFALRALIEIARKFALREDAPSSYRLAQEIGATDRQMLEILRKLETAKLVKEIGGNWTGFAPGGDPERMLIQEVIEVMEGGARELPDPAEMTPAKQLIGRVISTLGDCTSSALGERTVADLVRQLEAEPLQAPASAVVS